MDYSLLDDNVISSLNGDVMSIGGGEGDNNDEDAATNEEHSNDTEKVEIEVENGIGTKTNKVKKVNIHDAVAVSILKKGVEKMKSKNLPAIRYRRKCRIAREQVVL